MKTSGDCGSETPKAEGGPAWLIEPYSPSSRALDPVAYARVILALQRGERARAVSTIQEELGMEPAEAEARVEELWRNYQAEIPGSDTLPAQQRGPLFFYLLLVAVAALAVGYLWARFLH